MVLWDDQCRGFAGGIGGWRAAWLVLRTLTVVCVSLRDSVNLLRYEAVGAMIRTQGLKAWKDTYN
jgi:hypothetical protein